LEHLDGSTESALPVQDLRVVGDLHHADDDVDPRAGTVAGNTVPVPPLEDLGQAVANAGREMEPIGDVARRLAVGDERVGRVGESTGEDTPDHGHAFERRAAAHHLREHESHHLQAGLVDEVTVGSDPPVVPKGARQLM